MFLIWTYSVCLPTCLRNVCVISCKVQRWCTGYRIQWYETETNSLNNCSRGLANLNRIEVVGWTSDTTARTIGYEMCEIFASCINKGFNYQTNSGKLVNVFIWRRRQEINAHSVRSVPIISGGGGAKSAVWGHYPLRGLCPGHFPRWGGGGIFRSDTGATMRDFREYIIFLLFLYRSCWIWIIGRGRGRHVLPMAGKR